MRDPGRSGRVIRRENVAALRYSRSARLSSLKRRVFQTRHCSRDPATLARPLITMERKTANDFDQELLDLYDYYVHGHIDRRTFLDRAAKYAVGGLTALALLEMLSPQYALAAQVPKEDARVKAEYLKFPSPAGHGEGR